MYGIRWLLLGLIIITLLRINCTFDFLTYIELTTNIKFDIIVANTINGKRQLAMIPYSNSKFGGYDHVKIGHSSNWLYQGLAEKDF